MLDGPRRIVAIEAALAVLSCCCRYGTRLRAREASEAGRSADAFSFTLVTDGEILGHAQYSVRDAFRRVLARARYRTHEHARAREVTVSAVVLDNGKTLAADAVLVTTDAAAPSWFGETRLVLTPRAFCRRCDLQLTNDPDVFAAAIKRRTLPASAAREGRCLRCPCRSAAGGKPAATGM